MSWLGMNKTRSLESPSPCKNDLNANYEDDSGYKGHTTPRSSFTQDSNTIHKPIRIKKRLSFSPSLSDKLEASLDQLRDSVSAYVPVLITLVLVSSIFFTVFMGNRSHTGMK